MAADNFARSGRERLPPACRTRHRMDMRSRTRGNRDIIDVFDESFAEREPALVDQDHLTNSASRRIGFEAPEFICRAMIQAQAAVNAPRVVVIRRYIRARKSAHGGGVCHVFRISLRLLHEIKFHSRNGRGSEHFADRKRFLRDASTRSLAATAPIDRLHRVSVLSDTTPA